MTTITKYPDVYIMPLNTKTFKNYWPSIGWRWNEDATKYSLLQYDKYVILLEVLRDLNYDIKRVLIIEMYYDVEKEGVFYALADDFNMEYEENNEKKTLCIKVGLDITNTGCLKKIIDSL